MSKDEKCNLITFSNEQLGGLVRSVWGLLYDRRSSLQGRKQGDIGLTAKELSSLLRLLHEVGHRLSPGNSGANQEEIASFWDGAGAESAHESIFEAERKTVDAVGKWFDSDYMRVRVTHRDLIELVHPVELELYDAYGDLESIRKCPKPKPKGESP